MSPNQQPSHPSKSFSKGNILCRFVLVGCLLAVAGCQSEDSTALEPGALNPAKYGSGNSTPSDTTSTANDQPDTVEVGTLVGVITFDGEPPVLPPLIEKGDTKVKNANVCAAHEVPDESLLVNAEADNGVANVFVYLASVPEGAAVAVAQEPVVIDQKGCAFVPHARVVRVEQTISFKSSDPIDHNVRSFAASNQPFNITILAGQQEGSEVSFDNRELKPVSLKCDLHPWMRAYLLPLEHPYGAVTDSEGKFEIKNIPVGKHVFRIWHERAEFLVRKHEVEIKAGEPAVLKLSFTEEQFMGSN